MCSCCLYIIYNVAPCNILVTMTTSDILLVMTTSVIVNVIVTIIVMLAMFHLRANHAHAGGGATGPNLSPIIQITTPARNVGAAKCCGSRTANIFRSKGGTIHFTHDCAGSAAVAMIVTESALASLLELSEGLKLPALYSTQTGDGLTVIQLALQPQVEILRELVLGQDLRGGIQF